MNCSRARRAAHGPDERRGSSLWRRRARALTLVLLSAGLFSTLGACSGIVDPGEPPSGVLDLSRPWKSITPQEAGASASALEAAVQRAGRNHRMRSLLVAKDGRIVLEEYFGAMTRDSLHDVRSVTKSVVSLLAGVAVDRGWIASLDDPASSYLGPYGEEMSESSRKITVRHLLTMTAGFEWDEHGGDSYARWIQSDDPVRHLLELPTAAPPGERYRYNSAAVHLLGLVIEGATGVGLPDFAQRVLFDHIGVKAARWERMPMGQHNGGSGLDLSTRDLARLGWLALEEGRSGWMSVVPRDWIRASTTEGWELGLPLGGLSGIDYGRLWWLAPSAPFPLYFAWGYGGQFVVVSPEEKLVVAATNYWPFARADGGPGRYERETMSLIVSAILPAFR